MPVQQTPEGPSGGASFQAPGLLSRLVGVVVSPGETFGHIARDPRPWSTLAVVTILSAILSSAFFATEVGQHAWLDTSIQSQESFGAEVNDQQYAMMERIAGWLPYIVVGYVIFVGPLFTMALAGILKGAFAIIGGSDGTFTQALGVVASSGVILILRAVFTLPLNYVRASLTSTTSLGAFLPMLPEGRFAARFLGMVDLFVIWWVAVLAVGLAVLFTRRAGPIAVTLFAVYGAIAAAIALVRVFVGGS